MNNGTWKFETPQNSNIPSGSINAMVSDKSQILWLSTSDKGVIRLLNSGWQHFSKPLSLQTQYFTSIAKSDDGSIWAASALSELVHSYNDTCTVLSTGTSSMVTSVAIGGYDEVWCSTMGSGIIEFNGKSWKSYTMQNAGLPTSNILCLSKGSPGTFLFSIPGGKLYIINQ